MTSERIAVAMSGGVDSSVSAALLLSEGHEVFGLTMKTWSSASRGGSEENIRDAQRVAAHLGIAHHVVDLSEAFEREVVRYFADEYAAGRTPSPCAVCNRRIKFGVLLDRARELGATRLATGHYARILPGQEGLLRLLRGEDKAKDQSYFLFDLSQPQLRHSLFPLGELTKKAVRTLAGDHGLPVAQRPESQDLCFAAPGEQWRIVEKYRQDAPKRGLMVDTKGNALGEHNGIHRFTIGQRRGLGIAAGDRLYVAALHAGRNEVVLGRRDQLLRDRLRVLGLRWTSGTERQEPFRAATKIRYNHDPAASRVSPDARGTAEICFDEPQFAVAPGQIAAFYDGDELIGGGWIAGE